MASAEERESCCPTKHQRSTFFRVIIVLAALLVLNKIIIPSKNSSWRRHLQDGFKTSFVFVFIKRLQNVFRTSWSRRIYWPYSYNFRRRLLETSWRRLDQDQYIRLGHTSSRRLQDVFKTTCQDVFKVLSRRLQVLFKTSSRRL